MTRREFNEKISRAFLYALLVFLGAETLTFFERKLEKKTFKNSCSKDYYCLYRCPFKAIYLDRRGYPRINKKRCVSYNRETERFKWRKCGLCLRGCPTRALELINKSS